MIQRKRQGFTLIELMVVMAIIAILSTAGISGYNWYIKKAIDLKTTALLEELYAATLQFKGDHNGRLPDKAELIAQITPTLAHPAGNKTVCV